MRQDVIMDKNQGRADHRGHRGGHPLPRFAASAQVSDAVPLDRRVRSPTCDGPGDAIWLRSYDRVDPMQHDIEVLCDHC
jgi:hypothetical protein